MLLRRRKDWLVAPLDMVVRQRAVGETPDHDAESQHGLVPKSSDRAVNVRMVDLDQRLGVGAAARPANGQPPKRPGYRSAAAWQNAVRAFASAASTRTESIASRAKALTSSRSSESGSAGGCWGNTRLVDLGIDYLHRTLPFRFEVTGLVQTTTVQYSSAGERARLDQSYSSSARYFKRWISG